jgi:heme exporter protein B
VGLLRQTAWLWRKDFLLEVRRRENAALMFFFGVLLLFVFHFAFDVAADNLHELAPGLLWLACLFTGTLGLAQLFQPEKDNNCLDALLLSPFDRGALYVAKVGFNLTVMITVELVIFPIFLILFNLSVWAVLPLLLGFAFLGTLGFCALGTLISAAMLKAKGRELLLPFVLLPLLIPVIVGTVRGMQLLIVGGASEEILLWLRLLIGFDVIFFTAGFLIFEWVIEA